MAFLYSFINQLVYIEIPKNIELEPNRCKKTLIILLRSQK